MHQQYTQGADVGQTPPPLFLVEEITHRVLNEYTEAIATLALAAASAPDPRSQVVLATAAGRLRAHAEAHRALQAPINEGPLDLAGYITQLCASLTRAQLAERGVRLTLSADQVWLDAGQCWRVGLIVAELIRNATRHGFSGGAGAIRIELTETSGRIGCRVCDDGRGGAPRTGAGRGRRLVQTLAGELGGWVDWTFTPDGCCVRLAFPRSAAADPWFAAT
jgi:two-component sensor histidine kinase